MRNARNTKVAGAGLLFAMASSAFASDGVTGLPGDVTPLLSMAGVWQPVRDAYITQTNSGIVANDPSHLLPLGPEGREGRVINGWPLGGANAPATTPVDIAIFAQDANGNMSLATQNFVSDPQVNGGQSVIIADFNGDSRPDIFLGAHNESPFLPMPSTAYLSNDTGTFTKMRLNDFVCEHGANLFYRNGKPIVNGCTIGPPTTDQAPFYEWNGSGFVETTNHAACMHSAVGDFRNDGKLETVLGESIQGPGYNIQYNITGTFVLYGMDGNRLIEPPSFIATPYFNDKPEYSEYVSVIIPGANPTHTYRVWADDFNYDGNLDLVAEESIWTEQGAAVSMLQMLQGHGDLTFSDVTDVLNPDYVKKTVEMDYEMDILDLDHSGISSYLSGAGDDLNRHDLSTHNNFVFVNDGTGRLRYALRDYFVKIAPQIVSFVGQKLNIPLGALVPKFRGYRTPDGRLNFLAEILLYGSTTKFAFVNVPLRIDLSTMYTAPITVTDRNRSQHIRTFAGDDTIHAGPHTGSGSIDGGLGSNTVVYSGPRSNYSIALDGSTYVVTDNVGNDGVDHLTRIQHLQFSDQAIDLSGGVIIDSGFTGAWFDPNQSGHGLFLEVLPGDQLLAWWFTFDPAGKHQAWFGGVGPIAGTDATVVAASTTGGRWIPNFDPSKIVNSLWGTLKFTFSDCNHGRVDFDSGVSGYASGHMDLTRLTLPAGLACPATSTPADPNFKSFSGAWFDPQQSGHGLFLESLQGDQLLAWWFAFDPSGNPAWFGGVGPVVEGTAVVPAAITTGGRWIPNFDPTKIVNTLWGTLTFTFSDCNHGRVEFDSSIAGYGSGHMDLTRLTLPAGLSCP